MKNLHVLIVEDEIIIYMHISETLKKFGFEHIHTARNGEDALLLASQIKIDLLFCDIKINGQKDGVEVAKTIQHLYQTPVIFITAYSDQEILRRVAKVDFVGYLLKPYRIDELETLISLAISKYDLIECLNACVTVGDYVFYKKENILYKDKAPVILTKKESLFMMLLFNNINMIISYEVIDETVWHDTFVADNARRTFIYRFKTKLPNLHVKIEKGIGVGVFQE